MDNGRTQKKKQLDVKLGSWNVLSLHRPGALKLLIQQLKKYSIDIVALQEVRWTGCGTLDSEGWSIFYSGDERSHSLGTGFAVSPRCAHLITGFKPISPRICYLRIKGKFYNFSVLSAYAPTEVSEDEKKEEFYDQLDRAIDACPTHDARIIVGDLNAQVGRERTFGAVNGEHSLHHISNDNGQRLAQLAMAKNMVISSTFFPHKDIHKRTWCSPDGVTFNQIDSRHKSAVMDVRSVRGANVDSDHHLVVSRLRTRISNARRAPRGASTKFKLDKLQEQTVVEAYEQKIEESLSGNEIPAADIEQCWNIIKESIQVSANEIVGKEGNTRMFTWFDPECEEATTRKNEAYEAKLSGPCTRRKEETYRALRRTEKKLHRRKKRAWTRAEIEKCEEFRSINESRKLYKSVNGMRREYQPRIGMCRDREGNIVAGKQEVLQRWAEHFEEQLNDNQTASDGQVTTPPSVPIEDEPPSLGEVEKALKKLKNNKSPGIDELPAELFKKGGTALAGAIRGLISKIWQSEKIPHEWTKSIVCPIHKKGDRLECCNFRGISLLTVAYKILSNIIYERLLPHVEPNIGGYQCGFRHNKSTTDQIFSLRMILEKTKEFNITTHHLFVDFRAAYDSICRSELYKAMRRIGVPEKLIRMVEVTMRDVNCHVRVQGELSEPFQSTKGLRQGDALACILFNVALDRSIKDAGLDRRGTIFSRSVQILAYADDIDIIGRSQRDVKEAFLVLNREAKKMGLEVNAQKTKYMIAGRNPSQSGDLMVGEFTFQRVDSFLYLGSLVTSSNDMSSEISARLIAANRCYFGLVRHFKSRNVSRSTKVLLYKTLVRPVLTYGSETWTLSAATIKSLEVFERKILRRIFGPVRDGERWRARYNQEIYQLFDDQQIVGFIKCGRLRWAGHVARMPDTETPHIVLRGGPGGRRPRGRPGLRWLDGVEEDCRQIGVRNWKAVAQNRTEWRRLLVQVKARHGL
uniref:Reverse transcriptase domain-containing protein n=1 Tax=Lygus hesperus TaxID=30085 RepID=A0A0K8SN56_LYGHE